MTNKTIVIWGLIVISIVSVITYFGININNNKNYINMENTLKEAVIKYIDYEKKELPITITSDELKELDYLNELKYDDKICSAKVYVKKIIFWKNYEMNFTCSKKELD